MPQDDSANNVSSDAEFGLSTIVSERYSSYPDVAELSIDSFLIDLYKSNISKFNQDKYLALQRKYSVQRESGGVVYTFLMPVPWEEISHEKFWIVIWSISKQAEKNSMTKVQLTKRKKFLVNKKLSCKIATQGERNYSIGIIANGSNSNNANHTNMEKFLLGKLVKNNISLNAKEGFIIKINSEDVFTLGDHNIKNSSKVNEIKKMIETDEDLQKELTDICANLPSNAWSFNNNTNIIPKNSNDEAISCSQLTSVSLDLFANL
ncbi:MAG: hypothetical protein LBC74_06485 [Planctomycetaceae bacterium]|jgi:hypothetical protein|nr:hypothetical protein [Planctomycetaceae bacterium]